MYIYIIWHNAIIKLHLGMFLTIYHEVTVPRHPSEEKIIFGKHLVIFINSLSKGD